MKILKNLGTVMEGRGRRARGDVVLGAGGRAFERGVDGCAAWRGLTERWAVTQTRGWDRDEDEERDERDDAHAGDGEDA